MNMKSHTKHENGRRSLGLLGKHDQTHLGQQSDPLASATTVPRSMSRIAFPAHRPCSLQKPVSADDQSKLNKPLIPQTNLLTQALYMSHSGSSFGYRCTAVTAAHAICVCLYLFVLYGFPWREATRLISLVTSRFCDSCHFKILGQDFAKRVHFRPFESFGRFFGNSFTHKKRNKSYLENLG